MPVELLLALLVVSWSRRSKDLVAASCWSNVGGTIARALGCEWGQSKELLQYAVPVELLIALRLSWCFARNWNQLVSPPWEQPAEYVLSTTKEERREEEEATRTLSM